MTPMLRAGVRLLPTAYDVTLFDEGHEDYWGGLQVESGLNGGSSPSSVNSAQSSGGPSFTPVPDFAPTVADPPLGLVNGEFTIDTMTDPSFGWSVRGAASVENGAAVLREGDRRLSRFAQTFVVPEHTQSLRFTLTPSLITDHASLASAPPDALEVALLNTQTGASLLGTATGLTQTDAAFNLQQDGQAFFSSGVRVPGLQASPSAISDPPSALTVTLDLRGVQAGTIATLYVDLLGFGPKTSVVRLDHVELRDTFNTDPVVQAGADATVDEGAPFIRMASFTDPDAGDNWTATVDYGDGTPMETVLATPAASPLTPHEIPLAHTYADEGRYTVTVAVTDGLGSVGTGTFTTTVQNVAPVPAPIGPKSVNEGNEIRFTLYATDQGPLDGPRLTYHAADLPAGATFDPTTREFVWTPTEEQGPGSYVVTFSVSDGIATSYEAVTMTVNEVNVAPALAPIVSKSVNEEQELRFTISATDADIPIQTLTFSATELPAGATFNPTTREFVWTPTEVQGPDTYLVTFSVSDGVTTASEAVTITVGEVNQAPVLATIGPQTVEEGGELRFTVHASDPDVPVQTLTYQVAGLPAGATFDSATREFRWIPADNGTATVTFSVTDSVGATGTVAVPLTATNVAPTVDAGADQVVGLQKRHHDHHHRGQQGEQEKGQKEPRHETSVSITATFTDLGTLDTHTATIDWGDGSPVTAGTVTEAPVGPPGSTTGATGTVTGSHAYTKTGVYTVTVTVRDDDGGVRSDVLYITVQEPVHNGHFNAHGDVYRIVEDGVLQVGAAAGVVANDRAPAGATLQARVIQGPHHGALTFNANGAFRYVPDANFFGQDRFWYEFTDGVHVARAATVTLTVTPVNDAPVAQADAYQVIQGTTLRIRQAKGLVANDTDVDGDHLKALLVSGPAHGMLDLDADGTFTYRPQAGFVGADTFVYQTDDRPGGRSDPTLVTLTVVPKPALSHAEGPPVPAPCALHPVVIDWDGSQQETKAWLPRLTPKPAAWLPRFLLDLGRSDQERDPNRTLEIVLSGSDERRR